MLISWEAESIAAGILCIVLLVFSLGKSPFFRIDRAGVALIGASAMVGFGVMSFDEATQAIEYRTIVVLFSMMVLAANLKIAGLFELLGRLTAANVHSKKQLLAAVIMLSSCLSALAINDIVCLLLTPVVLMICQRGECDPLPHLLALALASNIGSAATFLGNPQNILIGNLSKVSFVEYFKTAAPIVFFGLILTYGLLRLIYKEKLQGPLATTSLNEGHIYSYLLWKSGLTLAFVLAFYVAGYDIALVSSMGAAFLLITRRINPNRIYENIDFNLLVIFIGLFVIIGGVKASGLLNLIQSWLPVDAMQRLDSFAFISIVLSNLVSNVPAVLLLQYYIPVEDAGLKWQALALFSTFAGNLTIFGSIANLIVAEIAKKNNVLLKGKEYLRVGFPLTVILSVFCFFWLQYIAG